MKISMRSVVFVAFIVLSVAAVLTAVPASHFSLAMAAEPAGFVLLGTGVLGGAVFRKRRIL